MSLLQVRGLDAHYGDLQALFGIELEVEAGSTVAIIGSNGAGKSTFLRSLIGLMPSAPASIRFDGEPIGALSANAVVGRGLAMVPEGRRLFRSLSVEENLQIGGYSRRAGNWDLAAVYALFPMLRERRAAAAMDLSGGQQQMVAIGRALMSNPRLLLCDELSLGLAPIVIRDIYVALPHITAAGTTVLIVEQDVARALSVADEVFCFQEGRVRLRGAPADLERSAISQAYFGIRPEPATHEQD